MLDLVDIKDMADRHALESAFDRMRGHFEDKETEANWAKRYTAIKTLNGITIGNSPYDFRDAYIAGIKSLVGGVIKAINSLVSRRPESISPLSFPQSSKILPIHVAWLSSRYLEFAARPLPWYGLCFLS